MDFFKRNAINRPISHHVLPSPIPTPQSYNLLSPPLTPARFPSTDLAQALDFSAEERRSSQL
jgi:hypothetical protein